MSRSILMGNGRRGCPSERFSDAGEPSPIIRSDDDLSGVNHMLKGRVWTVHIAHRYGDFERVDARFKRISGPE